VPAEVVYARASPLDGNAFQAMLDGQLNSGTLSVAKPPVLPQHMQYAPAQSRAGTLVYSALLRC